MKIKLHQILTSFNQLISGKMTDFNVEQRLYNSSVIIAIAVSLLSVFINVQLQLPDFLQYIISIGVVLLVYFYINARIFHVFYIWPFILISLVILTLSWLYNEGPFGSLNYIYIVALVVFLSISSAKNRMWVIFLVFSNLGLLYVIYYCFPELIHNYPSIKVREHDLMWTYLYVLILAILIFNLLRRNFEKEKQTVEKQKQKIEHQHKNITDSILYAKEIQQALLQKPEELKNHFKDSFIFWQPKDIVSGDFYLFNSYGSDQSKTIMAVADCTGHGVPGALITILGVSFFNEIVLRYPNLHANEFLDVLRSKVKDALKKGGNSSIENHDGMDMALIIYDKEKKLLEYSGANRPIYLIRDNAMVEFKPNRMPIGMHYNDNKAFTNHNVELLSGDEVVMFTDGYADQFGEKDNHKYYLANLKKLLIKNVGEPMDNQLQILKKEFENWKGGTDQTDDVLVLGFRP